MFSKKKCIIGLDIGSNDIKAVELTDMGGILAVTGFAYARLESPDALQETVRQVIQDGGFHTKRVVTAVSGRSVIVRYISMLQMSDDDLANAIRYEADKYIPFEVDEVVLDAQRLENTAPSAGIEDKEMKVLLVAVKRSLIEEHVQILNEIGLVPTIIDVDSFALGNAFELYSSGNPMIQEQDKVTALIDIGANKTNINIIRGTTSYFTREVYLAGNDFTDAIARRLSIDLADAESLKAYPGDRIAEVEECVLPSLDDLGNEIHLSFDYYENQFDREVDEVFVSGGSAKLPGIEQSFERIFGRKANFWDPTDNLDVRSERVDVNFLKSNCSQMAIAVGLASRIRSKI